MGGGEMIGEVRLEGFKPNELPYKFEAGTPPIAQAVGLGAAADWLDSVDTEALGAYESALGAHLIEAMDKISGVRILGRARSRAGIVAFTLEGVHAHDLSAYLDRFGIAVRAGHHCAQPLGRRMGVVSSARASFGAYSLPEDADRLSELVARAAEEL
jgi:cysteine desulfurase/selenocysteine lyase